MFVALAARPLLAIVWFIPASVLLRLCRGLGWLLYSIRRQDRTIALQNLADVYGDTLSGRDRHRLASACFAHFGELVGEHIYLRRGEKAWKRIQCQLVGVEHINRVLAKGKGAICITAHLGNWELAGAYACRNGFPLTAIALLVDSNPQLQLLLDEHRRLLGMDVYYARGSGMVPITRALKQNKIVVMLSDLRTPGKGVMVPFLGIPAHTQVGAITLAARTGAGLFVGHGRRLGRWRHEFVIEEPVELNPPVECTDDNPEWIDFLVQTSQKINQQLSQAILDCPEQWMWMHRRFDAPSKRHNFEVLND